MLLPVPADFEGWTSKTTTGFDLNLATQFIIMFMSMGVVLSQGSFFSLSLRLPVSQSVCCLCVDLFPSVLFCSSQSLSLLSLFSLFTLLCPFHPVLPIPISYLAKSFICLKYKWFERHNHSWLVGVDSHQIKSYPVLRLMVVLWAISCSLFSLFN